MTEPDFASIDLSRDLIASQEDLEARYPEPRGVSIRKESARLTSLERAFAEASPFYLLATSSAGGLCEVSPRGDPPGSVQVLDEQTLVLPDRAGNNRIDSLRNIVENRQVGLLFLVPGCDETLRINGTAQLSTNPELLERMTVQGKTPTLAIVVRTTAVYMHCARAFRRADLWNPASWPDAGTVPSMAAVLKDKLAMPEPLEEIAADREERYRTTLY